MGEQIHLERVDVDGDFSSGLHGVGVGNRHGLFGDAANFFEWLNGAELVVACHDGDKNGFGGGWRAAILEVN